MVVQLAQRSSRPVVNLFVSRQADGESSLAALAIVYPLAHLGYGWLNMMKPLLPTFGAELELLHLSGGVRRTVHFMLCCGGLAFAAQALLLWTPFKWWAMEGPMGVSHRLAATASPALSVFAFMAIPVCIRAIATSWCTALKETACLASSAAVRFINVLAGLAFLPQLLPWVNGATLGVLALLLGFGGEAIFVSYSAESIRQRRLRQSPAPAAPTGLGEAKDFA
jgi:hypothetical protein